MKLGIMQPYFFPYIGYFQLIHAVDTFMLHDNVNYIKNGWVNRNRLLVRKQDPGFVIAPIRKESKSSYRKIRDARLANEHWRTPLLKHIRRNYRRSPYFPEVYPLLEDILTFDTEFLSELNKKGIIDICRFLDIETPIIADVSSFDELEVRLQQEDIAHRNGSNDLALQIQARRVVRIVEICRTLGADTYINSIGGKTLYDKATFSDHGIALFFVKARPFTYPQPATTFHPSLSIIDVLMNCGKHKTKALLESYDLI